MKNRIIGALCIIIILLSIYIICNNSYRNEDVNKDGKVDALDLLIVQKYILKEMEKESDK